MKQRKGRLHDWRDWVATCAAVAPLMRRTETRKSEESTPPQRELHAPFDPDSESVRLALQRGQSVYRIIVSTQRDFESGNPGADQFLEVLLLAGDVLTMPENAIELGGGPDEPIVFSFVFASLLRPDQLAEALRLPPEAVELLAEPESEDPAEVESQTPEGPSQEPVANAPSVSGLLIRLGTGNISMAWALRRHIRGADPSLSDVLSTAALTSQEFWSQARQRLEKVPALPHEEETAGEIAKTVNPLPTGEHSTQSLTSKEKL